MEVKEIQARLEIIKLATTIGDHDTIVYQCNILKDLNSSKINEIISLLLSKNYRQALYLIKNYLSEMGRISEYEVYGADEEGERVLDIEDMLRMSPLAKDTIKDYKRSIYTDDDLETFAKNIEKPISQEYEQMVSYDNQESNSFIQDIEEEAKENIKAKAEVTSENSIDKDKEERVTNAINSANIDTPLDEISAEVLGESSKKSRNKTISKYKTLREKFARKEPKADAKELKTSNVAKSILNKVNKQDKPLDNEVKENKEEIVENINTKKEEEKTIVKEELTLNSVNKGESKLSKEKKLENEKKDSEIIYSPIPHIEQKFRQAFILYPPIKENDIWVEEVVKFLKHIAKNSFTERDVKILLDEYDFFLEKKDIAKASQVLLLAASTESKHAQFILARELFSGKILVRDLKKSFELMKSLANVFYPDAVCDLAQFYEYGIGVPKDKTIAIKLYEKAFQLGVERATRHITRLKESNSFFSTIFKMK